jgi:hypothetical protein
MLLLQMTDYDAAAHISEEVKKAAIAAPVAIFVAVIGTGVSHQKMYISESAKAVKIR